MPVPEAHRARLTDEWIPLPPEIMKAARLLTEHDLADFRVMSPEGKAESVMDVINHAQESGQLTSVLKEQLLNFATRLREHFVAFIEDDHLLADQAAGWTHTMGELARVLQYAEKQKMSPENTRMALWASGYSDSAKYTDSKITRDNFLWHHEHGAYSASLDCGLSSDEMKVVIGAIQAHQSWPREFMGILYCAQAFKWKETLDDTSGSPLGKAMEQHFSAEEMAILKSLLNEKPSKYIGKSRSGKSEAPTLRFIIESRGRERYEPDKAGFALKLDPQEQLLLRLAGLENIGETDRPQLVENLSHWYVPNNAHSQMHQVTMALAAGDNAQYATMDGAYKLLQLRGPGTEFHDGTVFDSIQSIKASYDDAINSLDATGREMIALHLSRNEGTFEPRGEIRLLMDQAIKDEFGSLAVPFYSQALQSTDYPNVPPEAIRVKEICVRLLRQAASMDPQNASDDFAPASSRRLSHFNLIHS